jgi:hypothetical protein
MHRLPNILSIFSPKDRKRRGGKSILPKPYHVLPELKRIVTVI